MLREEQIDLRRQRAVQGKFRIQNLGRNRVFSDYQVTNPETGGQYRVSVRGFDVGDNACSCPDFRTNTLGTCKHVEAVLALLRDHAPPTLRHRKASVLRPEVQLDYGEQLRVVLHLPARHSPQLAELARRFFDATGHWNQRHRYDELIDAVHTIPEPVTIFSDAMEFMEWEIERREFAQREAQRLQQLEAGALKLELLKVPLYGYQMRGALFLAYRGRAILGDDMGLGKTVQTMAAVEILARERGVERVLVVAPTSVKYQWEGEIRKFAGRPVQVVDGGRNARLALYRQPTFYRLVSYEQVLRDREELNAWHPDVIVLDEAQRIKNWESKTSRSVKKLRSRYAMVLTGTPLENNLEELYSIVQFVDDRRLGPAFQFLHEHRVLDERGRLTGYRNLDRIRERLAPVLLRRTRAEVLGQLPARSDRTVFVDLTEAQQRPYDDEKTTLARLVAKKYLTELDRRRILCCLANLRMLCDSTFLYDKQTHVSPKLDEFAELIRELMDAGPRKVVVFSQWEQMLRETITVLDRLKVPYTMLYGGLTGPERRKVLEQFRTDPACRVFLSTDAGGTGLNLQVADTVINLEVPWNPGVLEQRIARVHRMGQHRPVQVIHLVTRNSIEERVLQAVGQKKALFDGVFAGKTDEVAFESLGRQSFLDTVRGLVEVPPVAAQPSADPVQGMLAAGVQMLESLAPVLATGKVPLSPEMRQRTVAALQAMLQQLQPPPDNGRP